MNVADVEALEVGMEVVPETDVMMLLASISEKLERIDQTLTGLQLRVQSVEELKEDLVPIANAAFTMASDRLLELEQNGTLAFAQEGLKIAENITSSFTPEDVHLLGENVVSILHTVRNFTQPEVLDAADRAAQALAEPVEDGKKFGLIRGLRDPEVRRGMTLLLSVLRELGNESVKRSENHEPAESLAAPVL